MWRCVVLVANLLVYCSAQLTTPQTLAQQVSVDKSKSEPSSVVLVGLPYASPLSEYVVNVTDISSSIERHDRDANRSETASAGVLRLTGLHAGHEYSVSVLGTLGHTQQLVKQLAVLMQPTAPELNSSQSRVLLYTTNLTIRAIKPLRALQDAFRVNYEQMDPPKHYPTLDVHDIAEQRYLDIYLGNLSPGHRYNVSIIALSKHLESKPWQGLFVTKPLPPHNLSVTDVNSTCIQLTWNLSLVSGYDRFLVTYAPLNSSHKTAVSSSNKSVLLCDGLQYGVQSQLSVLAVKAGVRSEASKLSFTVKPKPALSVNVTVDMGRGAFRVGVVVPEQEDSRVQQCAVTIRSEHMTPLHKTAFPQGSRPRSCSIVVQLHPGTRYELWAATRSEGVTSNKLSSSFALQPAFDMNAFGLHLVEKEDCLMVQWPSDSDRLVQLWDSVVGRESALHVRIDPVDGGLKQQARQLEGNPYHKTALVVRGLLEGACYQVRMYTVTSSGIVSQHRWEQYYRMRAPQVALSVEEVNKRSIRVRLASEHKHDCIVHVVLSQQGRTVHTKRIAHSLLLDALTPFREYTLTAQMRCGAEMQACPVTTRTLPARVLETRQDKPGPVHNLSVHAINPFSAALLWCAPTLPNGAITHYIVDVHPMDERDQAWSVNVAAPPHNTTLSAVIDNLLGNKQYRLGVRAVTVAGAADAYAASDAVLVHMPLLAPPPPNGRVHVLSNADGHSVQVTYSTALFSNKHGLITRSLVIVAQVGHELDELNSTLTWTQVHRRAEWPPYAAVETLFTEPWPLPHRTISVTIGTDRTCAHKQHVCNGPLRSNVAYRFKLRLFTAPLLFTDSQYSEAVLTKDAGHAWIRTMTALGCLMLLGAAASVLLVLRSTRPAKACGPEQRAVQSEWNRLKMIMAERAAHCLAKLGLDSSGSCAPSGDVTNALAPFGHHRRSRSLRERTGVDQRLERLPSGPASDHKSTLFTVLSGCNPDKSRPVRVNDFVEHVRLMSADSDFLFSEEYEDLKAVGNGQPCIAADLTVNRAKNRFTNVLPYDHSRVKLLPVDDEDGSDYVNASYIPGFSSPREFIAAQGPLPSTRDHFWRVVWEQQCPAVVALTRCVEKGRDKCHQYWPDQHQLSVLYAHVEVTLMHETVHDEFTMRELSVCNVAEPNAPARILHHLHFMAWPDFGVPDQPTGIVEFARLFRRKLPSASCNKPSIVHCSAGVGRSGTFIALDRLLQCVCIERPLDVFGIVHEMRLQRCHMVQNEQQYIFIHHCLKQVIEDAQPASHLPSIQVHHNAAFDHDEGIAESGL